MTRPPPIDVFLDQLPLDPKERHEALVEVFGQYVFWMRNFVLSDKRRLVELSAAREQLATLFREPFDRMAELEPDERVVAYQFAQECVDSFARELLRLLANSGFDLPLSDQNVVRFRLVMELCNGATGDVIDEEVLNRGGRHFPDYWGRWLNRFAARTSD